MTSTRVHRIGECDDDITMMMLSNKSDDTTTPLNLPTPTDANTKDRMDQIDRLKYFLATATENWEESTIKRFRLPTGEDMSCILWNDLFYITGTDIVRSLTFRFHAFGRPVSNAKKFEEGIFSDLRNLKPGTDARLEEPKSELLDMLYKNNCIRTQKKQKVFYWYSVPHDRLFLDALERDLKREKLDMEPTTTAVAEPAASISLDSTQDLFDQLRKNMSLSAAALEDETARCALPTDHWNGWMSQCVTATSRLSTASAPPPASAAQAPTTSQLRRSRVNSVPRASQQHSPQQQPVPSRHHYHHLSHATSHAAPPRSSRVRHRTASAASPTSPPASPKSPRPVGTTTITRPKNSSTTASVSKPLSPMARAPGRSDTRRVNDDGSSKSLDSNALKKKKAIIGTLSLFDGSPTYKQRRRRAASTSSASVASPYVTVNRRIPVIEAPPPIRRVPAPSIAASVMPDASRYRPNHLAMNAAGAGYANTSAAAAATIVSPSPSPTETDFAAVAAAASAAAVGAGAGLRSIPTPIGTPTVTTPDWPHPTTMMGDTKMVEPERTYTCTQCSHLFKCLEDLDHHLHAHEMACTGSLIKDHKLFQDGLFCRQSTTQHDALPTVLMLNHEDSHHHHHGSCGGNRLPSVPTNMDNPSWSQAVMTATAAGGSVCSSTLSPMLDLEFGVQSFQTLNRSRTNSTSGDDSSSSSLISSPSTHAGYPSHLFPMQHHPLLPPSPDMFDWMPMAEEDNHRNNPHLIGTPFMSFKPELYHHHNHNHNHNNQHHHHHHQQQFLQPIQDNSAYSTTAMTHYPVQDTMVMTYGNDNGDTLMYRLQDTVTASSIPYSSPSFVSAMDASMTMMH